MNALQTEIEARLSGLEPEVEVLLAELISGSTLRLFIDHPGGVTLTLCEQVSRHLSDYRERYALEVSSPGQDRPLTKPQHYTRFLGRRARVRLREASEGHRRADRPMRQAPTEEPSVAAPPKVVVGELVGASDRDVTIAAHDGLVTIPYEQIVRSNLVPGD
ncbi:MAG: ribosome maturation factor RimP [Actinomycetota bacterium]|nr:ribosome maturation factor RimP [Actinomycetota bacterium]